MMRNACTGSCKIYFPNDSSIYYCPKCGKSLSSLQDNKQFIACSYDRKANIIIPLSNNLNFTQKAHSKTIIKKRNNGSIHDSVPSPSPSSILQKQVEQTVQKEQGYIHPTSSEYIGRISSYIHEEMPQNFFDKVGFFFRGLHCGNTRHTVTFTNEADSKSYQVIYYGAYRSTSPTPVVGDSIRVDARPNGSLFITENVYLGEGIGRRIRMSTQHRELNRHGGENNRFGAIIIIALIAIVVLAIGYIFIPQISGIINTYISVLFVVFLICLFIRPLQRLFRSPVWLLGVSVIFTAAIYNVGGLGTVLASLISPLITLALVVGIAYYFFRR